MKNEELKDMNTRTHRSIFRRLAHFCFFILPFSFFLPARGAGVLTPFVAYTTDIVGTVSSNYVTIEAWSGTNTITGVSTNLVLNFSKTYLPAASNGYFAGYLAPGNYRLTVSNLARGVVFGISASASTQNLAQLAGVPIYAFQNFTIAQFSDAGTAAYSNASAFFLSSLAGTAAYSNAAAFLHHTDTNWPLARITNAGTAGYSNAAAFLHHTDTNWPLARITNAGTAAYSNAAAFMDLVNNQTAAGLKTFSSTTYVHHIYATNLDVRTGGRANNLITTNGQNYGNAFSSVGTGTGSEQFGSSAAATANYTLAVGTDAEASAVAATAVGYESQATAANTSAFGAGAVAQDASATAIGSGAEALAVSSTAIGDSSTVGNSHTNSMALGAAAQTTKKDQIMLGSSSHVVSVGGNAEHFRTIGTNSFSDIAFRRLANTSLANGANAAVLIGTNTFVQVSGPSAAFSIAGLNGAPNRDGHLVIVLNKTGYDMTISNESGSEPTAANRIITMTGADRATTGNGAATFIYSASESRWQCISFDP